MTMGVAIILDNTVLLWADGRVSTLANPDPVTDTMDKIQLIGPRLAVMTSGIGPVGTTVENIISQNYRPSLTLSELIDLVEFSLTKSWDHFTIADGFDTTDKRVNCGVLLAGFVQGEPFILLSRQLYRRPLAPEVVSEPYQIAVNCSDTENALSIAQHEFKNQTDDVLTGSYENYVAAVENIGVTAIRSVAEETPAVGGTVRCAVSLNGAPFEKHIVADQQLNDSLVRQVEIDKVSLSKFINDNDKLVSVIGILLGVAVFSSSSPANPIGQVVVFCIFACALLAWGELLFIYKKTAYPAAGQLQVFMLFFSLAFAGSVFYWLIEFSFLRTFAMAAILLQVCQKIVFARWLEKASDLRRHLLTFVIALGCLIVGAGLNMGLDQINHYLISYQASEKQKRATPPATQ